MILTLDRERQESDALKDDECVHHRSYVNVFSDSTCGRS